MFKSIKKWFVDEQPELTTEQLVKMTPDVVRNKGKTAVGLDFGGMAKADTEYKLLIAKDLAEKAGVSFEEHRDSIMELAGKSKKVLGDNRKPWMIRSRVKARYPEDKVLEVYELLKIGCDIKEIMRQTKLHKSAVMAIRQGAVNADMFAEHNMAGSYCHNGLGESGFYKLAPDDVREIRAKARAGYSISEIHNSLKGPDVHRKTVQAVVEGKTHKGVV